MNPVAVRFVHVSDQVPLRHCERCPGGVPPRQEIPHRKKNAFDPSYIHRRGAYYEDTITISAILSPDLYETLKNTLMAAGWLYGICVQGWHCPSASRSCIRDSPVLTDDLRGIYRRNEDYSDFEISHKSGSNKLGWLSGSPDGDKSLYSYGIAYYITQGGQTRVPRTGLC